MGEAKRCVDYPLLCSENYAPNYSIFAMTFTVYIRFVIPRKWRSYWLRRRGRNLLLFLTLFRLVKICPESSYWATSLGESHGKQRCFVDNIIYNTIM